VFGFFNLMYMVIFFKKYNIIKINIYIKYLIVSAYELKNMVYSLFIEKVEYLILFFEIICMC
jgi:hypothetical protein